MANLPRAGQETYAENLSIFAGGGAYITGAYLVAAGVETSLCGTIPSGPFGAEIRAELAASGLNLHPCKPAAAQEQPQVTVVMSAPEDRAFLTRRTGAALPDSFPDTIASGGFTHLHIAELATLLECPDLVPIARENGLSISLDCAWDEAAMHAAGTPNLLANVDLFLPNEPELLKVSEVKGGVAAAAKHLAARGPVVVVKRGALGAMHWSPEGEYVEAPAHAGTAIDPTGAGDAFNAGYLVNWLKRASPIECLTSGNAFGRVAISQLGGAAAAKNLTW